MANYGPKDTQLVLVVGAQLEDALYHIKHILPRSSEITYQAMSIMVPRKFQGSRFNRVVFTNRAAEMVRKANVITQSVQELWADEQRMGRDPRIEWPDGL